jgi:hypothetical protein
MLQFVIGDLLEREDIESIKAVVENEAINTKNASGQTILGVRKQLDKLAVDQKKKTVALEAKKAAKAKQAAAKQAAKQAAKDRGEEYVSDNEDANDRDDDLIEEDIEEAIDEQPADEFIRHLESGGEFGKDFNFKPFLSSLRTGESWEKTKQKAKCGWCGKQPRKPQLTSCGHLICTEPCRDDMLVEMAKNSDPESNEPEVFPPCRACGRTITRIHPCEFDEDDTPDGPSRGTRGNKKKNKDKQRRRVDREDIADNWLDSIGKDVLPSAKTIAVKSQIMNWLSENPHVKIIVYTQFLAM